MTIEDIIKKEGLTEKFVLQKLICYFFDLTKEEMWIHIDKQVTAEEEKKILDAYHEIVDNKKPLEYVLGFVEFFKRKFYVNENTLIPRPETEYMILAVTEQIDAIKEKEKKTGESEICKLDDDKIWDPKSTYCLLDIWTGSGVLGISILLQNSCFFKTAIFSDISEKALSVAQQNYEILVKDHDFPVEFIKSDLLDFLQNAKYRNQKYSIILVGNLPYIPEKTFEENVAENVKKREPKMAFVGGDDGLIYYRKMLDQILSLIEEGESAYRAITLFLEMMTRQIDILRQEYGEHFNFEEVKTFHFNIRIVKATLI